MNIDIDLISLPMETVFFADEFPDDPKVERYHITGNFVTDHGDYHDLVERANSILGEIMDAEATSGM